MTKEQIKKAIKTYKLLIRNFKYLGCNTDKEEEKLKDYYFLLREVRKNGK